jgi:two-component sensor histidine kinase
MAEDPDWSHQMILVAEPISAFVARDFVGMHLVAHDLAHLVADICLVVSELATNAVKHAHPPFTLTVSWTDGAVLVALQDASTSFPVIAAPDIADTGGRGLLIVESLSREWGTTADDHGLKTVWATFAR